MNHLLKYFTAIFGFAATVASGGSLSVSNSKGFSSNPIVDRTGVVLTGTDPVIVAIGTFASASATSLFGAEGAVAGSVYSGLLAEFTPYGTSTSLLSPAVPLNLQGVFSFQDRVLVTGTPLAEKPVYLIVAKGTDLATATEVAILKTSAVFSAADDDNPLPKLVGVGTNLGTVVIVGSEALFTAVATPLDGTPETAYSLAEVVAGVAPTDLALSQDPVIESAPVATLVGSLSASDADIGDSFSYTLVAGSGDADNGKFTINDDQLLTAATLDYEIQPTAAIRVRVTDSLGLISEEAFTVALIDDRTEDFDMDGLTEAEEEDTHGTSDTDPDSDGDGWLDWLEVRLGTDAYLPGPGLDFAVSPNEVGDLVVRVGPGGTLLGFCVERSSTLSELWVEVADFPAGLPHGETLDWIDSASPNEGAFYRVGAYPLPAPETATD